MIWLFVVFVISFLWNFLIWFIKWCELFSFFIMWLLWGLIKIVYVWFFNEIFIFEEWVECLLGLYVNMLVFGYFFFIVCICVEGDVDCDWVWIWYKLWYSFFLIWGLNKYILLVIVNIRRNGVNIKFV